MSRAPGMLETAFTSAFLMRNDQRRAYIVHRTPSRLRFKFPERRHDQAFFSALQKQIMGWEGVLTVQTNPLTLAFSSDTAMHSIPRISCAWRWEASEGLLSPNGPGPVPDRGTRSAGVLMLWSATASGPIWHPRP